MPEPSGGASPGEWGGMAAGAVVVLGAVGKGVAWLASWRERRAISREVKLQVWHDELAARETKIDADQAVYQAALERRLHDMDVRYTALQREHNSLRYAFELVAGELRASSPGSQALRLAEQLLKAAFPLDPMTPVDMTAQLGAVDRIATNGD